jgi:hypothetical protein
MMLIRINVCHLIMVNSSMKHGGLDFDILMSLALAFRF